MKKRGTSAGRKHRLSSVVRGNLDCIRAARCIYKKKESIQAEREKVWPKRLEGKGVFSSLPSRERERKLKNRQDGKGAIGKRLVDWKKDALD